MAEALPKRKLRATSCSEIGKVKSGPNEGNPIYKVEAVNEAGAPVDLELRSFSECPLGELVEYGIKFYKNPNSSYPDSYTLYPPKEKLGRRVEALESQVAGLERRLAALEEGGSVNPPPPGGPSGGDQTVSTTAPASETTRPSESGDLPAVFG